MDQRRPAFASETNFIHVAVQAAIGLQTCADQIGIQHDGGEQIVEVMGDAADQSAYRFHLLRFAELFFGVLVFGDVLDHAKSECGLACRPAHE